MEKTIKDVFIDELHDILSAEQQIAKALPKVAEASSSPELKAAFKAHLQETKGQIRRLEKAFRLLKLKPRVQFCKGTKGLIDECNEVIKDYPKSAVRDAALISKAQRIEHYEISAYGTVCTFANELGHKDIASLLHETLNEESNADKKLTKLAEGGFLTSGINHKANPPLKTLKEKTAGKKKPSSSEDKANSDKKNVTSLTNKAIAAAKSAVTSKKKTAATKKKTAVASNKKTTSAKKVAPKKTIAKKTVVKSKASKAVVRSKARKPAKKSVAKRKTSALGHRKRA